MEHYPAGSTSEDGYTVVIKGWTLGLHDILHVFLLHLKTGDGDLRLTTELSLLTWCAWLSDAIYRAALVDMASNNTQVDCDI